MSTSSTVACSRSCPAPGKRHSPAGSGRMTFRVPGSSGSVPVATRS
jgi:hypothetical protein